MRLQPATTHNALYLNHVLSFFSQNHHWFDLDNSRERAGLQGLRQQNSSGAKKIITNLIESFENKLKKLINFFSKFSKLLTSKLKSLKFPVRHVSQFKKENKYFWSCYNKFWNNRFSDIVQIIFKRNFNVDYKLQKFGDSQKNYLMKNECMPLINKSCW